jgi:hypothetical protein
MLVRLTHTAITVLTGLLGSVNSFETSNIYGTSVLGFTAYSYHYKVSLSVCQSVCLSVVDGIIIIIRNQLDLKIPVSPSSSSLFKGLPSRLRPFGL